ELQRHLLRDHCKPFHGRSLATITKAEIAARLNEIDRDGGPIASNHTRSALSGLFRWAALSGYGIETNPVTFTLKHEQTKRSRVLAPSSLGGREKPQGTGGGEADEVKIIGQAWGDDDYGRICNLLLLTGARRDEIGSLRWSEVSPDLTHITLPPERVKNSREHTIDLLPTAAAILKAIPRRAGRDLVF